MCSCWLISAEALCGQTELTQQRLDELLSHCSPLGLLAEEITPDGRHLLGNFPQAYSHVGLINALAYLRRAQGKFEQDNQPSLSGAGESAAGAE